ncbi:MAG TPA: hypothetical protein VM782_09235 [Stellaceae bacterium]|nr:hypothetical protein [Stellaceae bacterium]
MWYSPLTFSLGKRDVIGAWLMCLVAAALFFGVSVGIDHAAAAGRAAVAASHTHMTANKCA